MAKKNNKTEDQFAQVEGSDTNAINRTNHVLISD